MTEQDKQDINHLIETREGHPPHMRFPADPDTTARLNRLIIDGESKVPWWRRLLQKLRGGS